MRIAVIGESSRTTNYLLEVLNEHGHDTRLFSADKNCRSLIGFKADRMLILRDHCRHSVVDTVRAANKRAEIMYLNVTSKSTIRRMMTEICG